MRKIIFFILFLTSSCPAVFAQHAKVNRQQFFLDDSLIEVTFTTDIRKLRTEKKTPTWQPATISMHFSDTAVITEEIRVEPRGIYRKQYCDMASLYLDFKTATSPLLSPLKKLKFVGSCYTGNTNEEFLLKEYLVYKMYEQLSVMSFRVRLLHVSYKDSQGKVKPYSQYAFLIEEVQDMGSRNNCVEVKKKVFFADQLNRQQVTFMCVFQYMIGNTDWAVPNYHNVKLLVPKTDTLARPYPVPYDFDYAGFVDAPYATPAEGLDLTDVKQRYYMGAPRNMGEVDLILTVFKEKKGSIYLMLNDFKFLSANIKKQMTRFLDGFYQIAESKNLSKAVFVDKSY